MKPGRIFQTPQESLQALENEARWPGLRVDSPQFASLPFHDRLRGLAEGYLSSAKSLCEIVGETPELLDWPRASVVCFLYRHALELFLKACIVYGGGDIHKCSHDIPILLGQYFDLYPDAAFRIQIPWSLSMDDIESALGVRPDVEPFEEKPDQVYRYLADRHGSQPKAIYSFAPGTWLWMIERLEDDVNRVWANIREFKTGASGT